MDVTRITLQKRRAVVLPLLNVCELCGLQIVPSIEVTAITETHTTTK